MSWLNSQFLYADAISGRCGAAHELSPNLQPLFDTILREIPAPTVDVDGPLQMVVTNLGYDEYKGATAVGRIHRGRLKQGQRLARIQRDGKVVSDLAKYLFVFYGLEKKLLRKQRRGTL